MNDDNREGKSAVGGMDADLAVKMDQAWETIWTRFYQDSVRTFVDYLVSYESGKERSHLPTAEEVKRQYPNPCGYGSGMEDGAILGGAMLSIIIDRYAVEAKDELRDFAAKVFSGLWLCATAHGVPGFVARNVCPEDQKSIYVNTSRDQYTHCVHGLWKYYRSSLADVSAKAEIGRILGAVAERMIRYVVPENDYDSLRADGEHDPLGISRMWNVQAHEAARLPMIYAAAWETTGNEKYYNLWREYVVPAIEQSASPADNLPAYALLQMQCSFELLHALEEDPALKNAIRERMELVAELSKARTVSVWEKMSRKDPETMRMVGPDWRHVPKWINQNGYPNPQWGPYREIWHIIREAGESAIVSLMLGQPGPSTEQREFLQKIIRRSDYLHNSSCGIIYHLGAYWKARLLAVL